jgi:DNA polymerase III subunit delta
MPASDAKPSGPFVLVCGEDEFAVSQRAKQLYQQWTTELGGMDHEIIDASAANSGEALRALAKLREALQTLPFFGSGKAIWFQSCNFLGDERTGGAQAVSETLTEVAKELKEFSWNNVRLLITAGKVDKRKTFFKTVEKIGVVQQFAAWSVDDKNWAAEAEITAQRALRTRQKNISEEALAELINCAGINARLLNNEIEKLSVYVGDRPRIEVEDVTAIVTRNKQARAFALGDALGDRDLPRVLRTLDEELWGLQFDKQKSEIGLLYGLITKVRVMLFLKEMLREGWLKPDGDYNRFKTQLERAPADSLPDDKRFNPLAMNPYVLFKALPHARRYSTAELVRAMDLLLECNQRLIFSNLDGALLLQQTLVQIVHGGDARPQRAAVV